MAVLDDLVGNMRQLVNGVMFGSGIYLFLGLIHVHERLAIAIFGGATWAFYGLREQEKEQ